MEPKEFFTKTKNNLKFFTYNIFSDSFRNSGGFSWGKYPAELCDYTQENIRSMALCPRTYFKSTNIYSTVCWKLWKLKQEEHQDWFYFSFSDQMAGIHIKNIKNIINCNRFFRDAGLIDLKSTAESVVKYTWNDNNEFSILPFGSQTFKRGLHGHTICDDILADPANELNLTTVDKINKNFREQIYFIPMRWHEFHIRGTPQTTGDLFFDSKLQKEFKFMQYQAIVNEAEKKVLWPEWETFDELISQRQGNALEPDQDSERYRAFMKEKMCMPIHSANAYLSETALRKRINKNLVNIQFNPVFVLDSKFEKVFEEQDSEQVKKLFRKFNINLIECSVYDYDKKWDVGEDYLVKLMEDAKKGEFYLAVYKKRRTMNDVVAGIDPGKMVHPAFYTVFEKVGDRWIQLHLQWMYHWDYKDQIEHINLGRDLLDVDYTYYDSTRGEYEGFVEKGDLDSSYVPVNFGSKDHQGNKMKKSLAAQMNVKLIETEGAELINDETQVLVMLTVDRELIAVETNINGRKYHGDSFWGVALAIGGGEVMSKMRVI